VALAYRVAMYWHRNTGHLIGQAAEGLLIERMTHRANKPSVMWCTNELPTATEGYGIMTSYILQEIILINNYLT
jgi:hypothetical protein